MKWFRFSKTKGSYQKLPKTYKPVLICLSNVETEVGGLPEGIAVGYLKYAAGDKQSPNFIHPGVGPVRDVIAWCDCLPTIDVVDLWREARGK